MNPLRRLPYLYARWLPLGWEFTKYCASGGSRLLLNIGLLTVIVELAIVSATWAPFISGPILFVLGYAMTNWLVFNHHDSPSGGGHLSRSLLWYGALWTGKGVNYGLYVALIHLTAVPYQVAWFVGAVAVAPYTFAVSRYFWSREFALSRWPPLTRAYDRWLRARLPTRVAEIDGVRVVTTAVESPDPERDLRDGVRAAVREGDRVVVVGGGYGFSTVEAARVPGVFVTAYEASAEMASRLQTAVIENVVAPKVQVKHAVVGEARKVYGPTAGVRVLAPDDLPACDVLVLDCEGAEADILASLVYRNDRPRAVVVETHGFLDSPTAAVVNRLAEQLGYRVEWVREVNAERDIAVVYAER